MSRLPYPIRNRIALAVSLALAASAVAGDVGASTGLLTTTTSLSPERFRLDAGAGFGLPLLATYADPGASRWRFAWRGSRRPWGCGAAESGSATRYTLAAPFAKWMPAMVIDDGPDAWRCQESGWTGWDNGMAGRAEASLSATVGALRIGGLADSSWIAPKPGGRASWFGESGSAPRPCTPRSVAFLRYGSESDRFPLLGCDGSVDGEAIDHLSVMARPIGVGRPELPLPDEPGEGTANGEWLSSIKLVHPRLVWVIEQIASAFPGRTIYIVSGYRTGEHSSAHGDARALDINVMGVAKELVYKRCRKLRDTGCGYYPNHNFVHVDTRPVGSGGSYWIDVSQPGQKSEYVSSWPGVEEGIAGRWVAGEGD